MDITALPQLAVQSLGLAALSLMTVLGIRRCCRRQKPLPAPVIDQRYDPACR